jgi:outer membrane protein assembly factor BamB
MQLLKAHFWKLTLLSGAVAVAGWLGWGYANQRRPTLIALDTTTGKLQWVYPLAADFGYSKGAIAGNGKVVLDACIKTADNYCGAYQIQTFDNRSGKLLWSDRPSGNYLPYNIASNQAAVIQNDRLYLQLENELQMLDLTTGVQQWRIPRRWFFRPSVWYGMGLVAEPNKLAMLKIDNDKRSLQTLDPKTGKLQQQATVTLPKYESTHHIIATNDRTLFLETAGLVPTDTPNSFYDRGTSTVAAYDSKTLQPRFRTDIKSGGIFQMEAIPQSGGFANENILLIGNYDRYDVQTKKISEGSLVAMDANTGQVLWQKTPSQFNCSRKSSNKYRVDASTIYLDCSRYPNSLGGEEDSQVVAISTQTGAAKWQTQLSTDRLRSRSMSDLPTAMTDRQYLTFRKVTKAKARQTQAVALDRHTGKLLWAFPQFDDEARYVNTFRSIVAAEGDRFFTLDRLPRWQLWLLQMNLNWYLNQPIAQL